MGDHRAFAQYHELNKGLFDKILRRYSKWATDYASVQDMRQEGLMGLMKGVQRYKLEKSNNKKPEGYIYAWVRAYIANYARANGIAVASKFVSEVSVRDRKSSDPADSYSIFDSMEDENADTDEKYRQCEVDALFTKINATLLPKERIVATRRLFTDTPDTLETIGEDLGVSRERIRQIELLVRRKLKWRLRSDIDEICGSHATKFYGDVQATPVEGAERLLEVSTLQI